MVDELKVLKDKTTSLYNAGADIKLIDQAQDSSRPQQQQEQQQQQKQENKKYDQYKTQQINQKHDGLQENQNKQDQSFEQQISSIKIDFNDTRKINLENDQGNKKQKKLEEIIPDDKRQKYHKTELEKDIDIMVPFKKFPLEIPKGIIKAIIVMILSIVGKMMHIMLPFGGLAADSCPEAAGSLGNIYQIIQAEEKTQLIKAMTKGFPIQYIQKRKRFFDFLGMKYIMDIKEKIKYDICGQQLFTLHCSVIYCGCNLLAWLFTNPPILVLPPLQFLPKLVHEDILPGDNPFCFIECIKSLIKCQGYWFFTDLSVCGGVFNLDNLIRATSEISTLLYIVFTFVPGFCCSFPFQINMWMIPRLNLPKNHALIRDNNRISKQFNNNHNQNSNDNYNIQLQDSDSAFVNSDSQFQFDFFQKNIDSFYIPAVPYPYDIKLKEQDWFAIDWENTYRPYLFQNIGFNQNLEIKKLLSSETEKIGLKADQMYQNQLQFDKNVDKYQFIKSKILKMKEAAIYQEMPGKITRYPILDQNSERQHNQILKTNYIHLRDRSDIEYNKKTEIFNREKN